jgi:hypothetical protein
MGDMSERRRFPRYPCKGSAEIYQNGQLAEWGIVSDIGRCGCYIETLSPLLVGTEVELRLSVVGVFLMIHAKIVCATPLVGMGMEFLAASREQENLLAQILGIVTSGNPAPSPQPAEHTRTASATICITREAAPEIFAKMLKRINENGVVTKEELVEMVRSQ